MIKLILTCAFAIIAIMYTYRCIGGLIARVNTSSAQVFLMALGIVGTIACICAF